MDRWRVTLISHRNQDYLDYSQRAGWEHPVFVSSDMDDAMGSREVEAALDELRAAKPGLRTGPDEWPDEDKWEYLGGGYHRVALRARGREHILVWNEDGKTFRVDFPDRQ